VLCFVCGVQLFAGLFFVDLENEMYQVNLEFGSRFSVLGVLRRRKGLNPKTNKEHEYGRSYLTLLFNVAFYHNSEHKLGTRRTKGFVIIWCLSFIAFRFAPK
jgi:hypothetical protein